MRSAKMIRTSLAAAFGASSFMFASHAAGQENADALWNAMAHCAAMRDAASRHACADEALMSAGLLTKADITAQRRQNFGLPAAKAAPEPVAEPKPAPKAALEAEPGPEAVAKAESAEAPETETEASEPPPAAPKAEDRNESEDEITVTLAEVAVGRSKRVILITEEGAVWRQTDGGALRPNPKPGQTMTIEKTSFGGFMCKIGKWTVFRCQRQA